VKGKNSMELTPNDIRNFEFPSSLRGYDKEAVDNFEEQVALIIENLKQENLRLTMELESVKIQLSGIKQFENVIKDAAIDARRNADQTISNARKEAELILSRAASDAEQHLTTRAQRNAELEASITKLELTKKSYLNKLRGLISSHLEWLDDLMNTDARQNVSDEDIQLDVTESHELSSKKLETFATQASPQTQIKTEESNAASRVVQSFPEDTVPASKEPVHAQPEAKAEPEQTPIDPELAQALESYRKLAAVAPSFDQSGKTPIQSHGPATTKIPNALKDYIPKESGEINESTDRVKVSETQKTSLEFNSISGDEPIDKKPKDNSDPSNDLAKVLDDVVSKFEEEMDKAAKS
jgi:cell division initiation protein